FRIDYFRYYYLGIAYLELHQYPKAQQNFAIARPTLSAQLLPKFEQYQQRLATETGRGRAGSGREFAARDGGGRDAVAPRPEPPRSTNPAFEQAVQAADAALASK